jgi:hypothetical protein
MKKVILQLFTILTFNIAFAQLSNDNKILYAISKVSNPKIYSDRIKLAKANGLSDELCKFFAISMVCKYRLN